ncbi:MAG: phytanoyl-CoA dioxygenase family protein [Planctomycetes bacterium]|nr:phytanoyl-CoA dioxygenase family protein [Planctomycetota bacterium]
MPRSLEDHASELRTQGYTVVENVLSPEEVAEANATLEAIFEQEKELGPKRGWHNNTYKVAYMLPQKHELFRRIGLNPRVLPLMKLLLGDRCVLASLNGLTMTPGGKNQDLHIDQNETIPGSVLYVNALHTLDPFTRANGCTRVVPRSQDRPYQHGMDMAPFEKEAVYLEAPAGSLIAYNGGLWHAGSANQTQNNRRALHLFYSRPWVRAQWDYTKSLSPEVIAALTQEQKQLFGFYAQPGWYDWQENIEKRYRG